MNAQGQGSENTNAAGDNPSSGPPVEQTIDDVIVRYYGEWILMQLTGFDAYHHPERGYLLAHSPDRREISRVFAMQPPRAPDAPYRPYYL